MKSLMMILIALSTATVANASQTVCGTLSSATSSPKCEAGQMCPHFIRVIENLTKTTGETIELQTKSAKVLKAMSALNGSTVCAKGNSINDAQFEVTSLRSAKSAF